MQVVINGQDSSINEGNTVADLIENLQLRGKIAVEINRMIIPRSKYSQHIVKEGDEIEIVQAIGGG